MEVVIMIAQLILGLSILVGVHELGHMLSAKYFGMRVEKFSIGFPPKIFGIKKGETEYSIGAIPLGGFVKISGMVDESLDTDNLNKEPQPYEFRSKPAYQRLIVMLGGIIVNVITAFIINIGLLYFVGESVVSMDEINKSGIVASSVGKKVGIQTGDQLIELNGNKIQGLSDLKDALFVPNSKILLRRAGKDTLIQLPSDILDIVAVAKEPLVEPMFPYHVDQVKPHSAADVAGIKSNDYILNVNGVQTKYFHQLRNELEKNKNKTIELTVLRNNDTLALTAKVDSTGILGFVPTIDLKTETKEYSFIQSIGLGVKTSIEVVTDQVKAFGKMITGDLNPKNSVGSFFSIGKAYGGHWDWVRFWTLTATLSMVLAFMNLLPIPALDGGHVMFLMYEIIVGKKPSDKFLEGAQKVGMVLLFSLMIYAVSNDIIQNFFN
jgi:regulator of sigma E protease